LTDVLQLDNSDAFVKSRKSPFSVIPAKAGIQEKQGILDPGFRRGDGFDDFLRGRQFCFILYIMLFVRLYRNWRATCAANSSRLAGTFRKAFEEDISS
jgi:hypothetical protein